MWPIIVCAFFAIAIVVERFIYFYFTYADYEKFKNLLTENIKVSKLSELNLKRSNVESDDKNFLKKFFGWIRCQRWNRSQYVKIATVYIENIAKGHRSREEALKRIGSEEIERMEKNFNALSAISHVTPLLGLLGTVTGIIAAFSVISELGGQVDVSALASGIWEAMITTASGLTVAIPAQLSYLYFEKIVSARANRMGYTITYLNESLFSDTLIEQEPMLENHPKEGSKLIKHEADTEEIVRSEVK